MAAMDSGSRRRQLRPDLARIELGEHVALADVGPLVDHHFSQTAGIFAGDVDPFDLDPSIHPRQPRRHLVLHS